MRRSRRKTARDQEEEEDNCRSGEGEGIQKSEGGGRVKISRRKTSKD